MSVLSQTLFFAGIFTAVMSAICLLPRNWIRFLPWLGFSMATLLAAALSIATNVDPSVLPQHGQSCPAVPEGPQPVSTDQLPLATFDQFYTA